MRHAQIRRSKRAAPEPFCEPNCESFEVLELSAKITGERTHIHNQFAYEPSFIRVEGLSRNREVLKEGPGDNRKSSQNT